MRLIPTGLVLLMLALPAQAETPLSGSFTATIACPAYQSINRQTNPGSVKTEPGQAYELVAGNRPEPSHFWIVMPGAAPDRRWVAVDCGTTDGEVETEVVEPGRAALARPGPAAGAGPARLPAPGRGWG